MNGEMFRDLVCGTIPIYVDEDGDNLLTTEEMYGTHYDGKPVDAVRVRIDVRTDGTTWHELRSEKPRDIADEVAVANRKFESICEDIGRLQVIHEAKQVAEEEVITHSLWVSGSCFAGIDDFLCRLRSSHTQQSSGQKTTRQGMS